MKGLAGKVAVVTGGSSGIGLATARELGKAGAKVALVARTRERGVAAEQGLREEGVEALYVQADMGKGEDVRRMGGDGGGQVEPAGPGGEQRGAGGHAAGAADGVERGGVRPGAGAGCARGTR